MFKNKEPVNVKCYKSAKIVSTFELEQIRILEKWLSPTGAGTE